MGEFSNPNYPLLRPSTSLETALEVLELLERITSNP
jgi:hypothetical protein